MVDYSVWKIDISQRSVYSVHNISYCLISAQIVSKRNKQMGRHFSALEEKYLR